MGLQIHVVLTLDGELDVRSIGSAPAEDFRFAVRDAMIEWR